MFYFPLIRAIFTAPLVYLAVTNTTRELLPVTSAVTRAMDEFPASILDDLREAILTTREDVPSEAATTARVRPAREDLLEALKDLEESLEQFELALANVDMAYDEAHEAYADAEADEEALWRCTAGYVPQQQEPIQPGGAN